MEQILSIISVLWFVYTFYFTIVITITTLKIFDVTLLPFRRAYKIKETKVSVSFSWICWFYQIYFWMDYFGVKIY